MESCHGSFLAPVGNNLRSFLKVKYCDINIVVGKDKLESHRVLLARIPKLERMMDLDKKLICTERILNLTGIVPESELQNFINFLFSGELKVNSGNSMTVLNMCRNLELSDDYVLDFLSADLDLSNCLKIMLKVLIQENVPAAHNPKLQRLEDAAVELFIENQKAISQSQEYLELTWDQIKALCTFLKSRIELRMLFETLMAWCAQDVASRSQVALEWYLQAQNSGVTMADAPGTATTAAETRHGKSQKKGKRKNCKTEGDKSSRRKVVRKLTPPISPLALQQRKERFDLRTENEASSNDSDNSASW